MVHDVKWLSDVQGYYVHAENALTWQCTLLHVNVYSAGSVAKRFQCESRFYCDIGNENIYVLNNSVVENNVFDVILMMCASFIWFRRTGRLHKVFLEWRFATNCL